MSPGLRRPARRVSPKARRRPGEVAALVVAILCVAGPVLFSLWQRGELLRYGYEIESLKAERDRLAELRRKLLVERASLESLERVEAAARQRLRLEEPDTGRLYVVAAGEEAP